MLVTKEKKIVSLYLKPLPIWIVLLPSAGYDHRVIVEEGATAGAAVTEIGVGIPMGR